MTQTDEALRVDERLPPRLPAGLEDLLNGLAVDHRQIRSSTVRIALLVLFKHSDSEGPCASGEFLCPGQSRALRILQQAGVVADADDTATGSSVAASGTHLPRPGPHLDRTARDAVIGSSSTLSPA